MLVRALGCCTDVTFLHGHVGILGTLPYLASCRPEASVLGSNTLSGCDSVCDFCDTIPLVTMPPVARRLQFWALTPSLTVNVTFVIPYLLLPCLLSPGGFCFGLILPHWQ
jgi:hypothetical protein